MGMLNSTVNQFKGIIVTPTELPEDPETFIKRLNDSIRSWEADGYLVVWLQVPLCKTSLIPRAISAGFQFHHSGDDYLMLTLQLSHNAYVPPFASHYAGAGGVVINVSNELLVVCERHRPDNKAPYYKLPGGTLKAGEDLVDAVVREVLEETGIETRFESLVCVRQMHGYRHGKSDFYFVCKLTPMNTNILMQTEEIEECIWMPVGSYMNSNMVSPFNKSIVQASMETSGMVRTDFDGFGRPDQREFFMPGVQYGRPWNP